MHGLQPAQLVGVFLGAHVLAVDHVEIDDAYLAHGGRDRPRLRIVEARDGDLHVGDAPVARQDGHAVVGLLAVEHAAVTGLQQGVVGEAVVLQLGFLQPHHVGREFRQPLLQLRQPHIEGIDVPAGDLHADSGRSAGRMRRSLPHWTSMVAPPATRSCARHPEPECVVTPALAPAFSTCCA